MATRYIPMTTATETRTPGRLKKPSNIRKFPPKQGKQPKPTTNVKKPPAPNQALERKLIHTVVENDRLQKLADKLSLDLKQINLEYLQQEQEHERVNQQALLTKNQLSDQRNITLLLEKKAATQRAHQAVEQTKLLQKIRSLTLSTKAKRIGATQTDGWSGKGIMDEAQTQTMEELTKEKADKMLRDSDQLLTAFITELEREKINAQNELKFSLHHLEQRLKDDHSFQLRRAQENNDRRLEELTQQHTEQLKTIQHEHDAERERWESRLDEMMKEIDTLRDANDVLTRNLDSAQEKLKEQATQMGKIEAQKEIAHTELVKLRDFKKTVQRDVKNVIDMRNELNKYKDINEIILKEFAKLEEERDGLIAEMEQGIRNLGGVNSHKNGGINLKVLRLRELTKLNA